MKPPPAAAPAPRIDAVLVTYRPEPEALRAALRAIAPQVSGIWIIANAATAATCDQFARMQPGVRCHALPDNRGIAHAQNLGCGFAIDAGATHLLLLDQDSLPAPDMVRQQCAALHLAERAGQAVAAVAPVFLDARRGAALKPFFRIGRRLRALGCGPPDRWLRIDTAIASGLLIPVPAFTAVGSMREDLFIDLVDIDWCLRARAAGLPLVAACQARLTHRLGQTPKRWLGRSFTHHDPLRNYYFFRNAIWLCRQPYPPLAWKRAVLGQLARRIIVYPLAIAPRAEYLRMMRLGVTDGWRGRLGPLQEASPR